MPHAWWWNHYISKFCLLAFPPIALNQRGFILEWAKFSNFRIILTTKCTQSNIFDVECLSWSPVETCIGRWNDLVLTSDREREAHWGPIRSLTPTLRARSVSEMDGDRNGPKTVLPSKMIVADHDRTGKWACDLAPCVDMKLTTSVKTSFEPHSTPNH